MLPFRASTRCMSGGVKTVIDFVLSKLNNTSPSIFRSIIAVSNKDPATESGPMAKSESHKQKKLAKKRSKELAKKKELAREKNRLLSFAGQWEAATGPFVHCYVSRLISPSDNGIGSVIVSRRGAQGKVAMVRILVDALFLGVKSIDVQFASPSSLSDLINRIRESGREDLQSATPEYAAKLVHSAIQYARSFGLEPAAQWNEVKNVFDGVDYDDVELGFEFGRDGKPVFVQGPFDTPERIEKILATVQESGAEMPTVVLEDPSFGQDFDDDLSALDDPELDVDIDEDVPDQPQHNTIDAS